MKRKIKFRGKREDNRRWVYGYYVIEDNDSSFIIDKYGQKYKVRTDTVGQYTGVTDKNGKEIYEGDIIVAILGLFYASPHLKGVVSWRGNKFVMLPISKIYKRPIDLDALIDIILVGNVWDNPELLKDKNNEK